MLVAHLTRHRCTRWGGHVPLSQKVTILYHRMQAPRSYSAQRFVHTQSEKTTQARVIHSTYHIEVAPIVTRFTTILQGLCTLIRRACTTYYRATWRLNPTRLERSSHSHSQSYGCIPDGIGITCVSRLHRPVLVASRHPTNLPYSRISSNRQPRSLRLLASFYWLGLVTLRRALLTRYGMGSASLQVLPIIAGVRVAGC